VLTRREGERIWFGLDNETIGFVEVLKIKGAKISLACTFDEDIRIARTEPQEVTGGA
jgi:sRNA-binding carbon storage regulator CsrA